PRLGDEVAAGGLIEDHVARTRRAVFVDEVLDIRRVLNGIHVPIDAPFAHRPFEAEVADPDGFAVFAVDRRFRPFEERDGVFELPGHLRQEPQIAPSIGQFLPRFDRHVYAAVRLIVDVDEAVADLRDGKRIGGGAAREQLAQGIVREEVRVVAAADNVGGAKLRDFALDFDLEVVDGDAEIGAVGQEFLRRQYDADALGDRGLGLQHAQSAAGYDRRGDRAAQIVRGDAVRGAVVGELLRDRPVG